MDKFVKNTHGRKGVLSKWRGIGQPSFYGKFIFMGTIHPIPKRTKNNLLRDREYLTSHEVDQLIHASKQKGRHHTRDSTMILMAYRHGLRVSELVSLKWSQIDLDQGYIHVMRRKGGISSTHPLFGPELRALRKIQRDETSTTDYVFLSERKSPMTTHGFRKLLKRAGTMAHLSILCVHPHMLRHATGFKLANDGTDTRSIQHYLGHKNIQHTVRYTELSPARFKDFWPD